ncbi:ATP/GTP-binding protein [Dactylosporangium sp. NPDC000521]|uniref:GTP-binding protein n=1 Tax=Dactylosporangium sp. NPDC000521 TaxID=3363975 RepID=UPI00369AFC28
MEPVASRGAAAVKVFLGGGFGAGKTTAVGAVTEVMPLVTEALMTVMSVGVDDTRFLPDKTTTTALLDFGRVTLAEDLVVYLFSAGGQPRKWPLWFDLARGSAGAVALVDTRRLEDAFAAVDFFEGAGVPFVVAVNCFDGVQHHTTDEVRTALNLSPGIPVVACDARSRASVLDVLIRLLEHALRKVPGQRAASTQGATASAVTGHAR